MKAKEIILVVVAIIATGICVACLLAQVKEKNPNESKYTVRNNVKYFEEDYTIKHKALLDAMFSKGWQVTSRQEKRRSIEGCSHMDTRDIDYFIWDIEYTDYMDNKRIFTLNNHQIVSYQISRYFENLIEDHYKTGYMNKYFADVPLLDSYVYCFFVNPSSGSDNGWTDEKWEDALDRIDKYEMSLGRAESTIDFGTLVPEMVFKKYPVSLYVRIALEDEKGDAAEKERLDKLAKERTEEMIKEIDEKTDGDFNANISVTSGRGESNLYDGENEWMWGYYVRGKKCPDYYQHRLYDAYEKTCFSES